MSHVEMADLLAVVMSLQSTVQTLSSKVDLVVQSDGTGLGKVSCDDAVDAAEQSNEKDKVEKVNVVPPIVIPLEKQSVGTGGSAFRLPNFGGSGITPSVPIKFGTFDNDVPGSVLSGKHSTEIVPVDSVPSSPSGGGSESWSDMVEEELSERVVVKVVPPPPVLSTSFYKEYVRSAGAKEFHGFLSKWGIKIPKNRLEELALVRFTAATMPDAFKDGRRRLKMLALIGDKIMAFVATLDMYLTGSLVNEVQSYLSGVLTRVNLSPVFVNCGMGRHLVAPSGVDIGKTSVGGEALEAVFGVVYMSCGINGVRLLMQRVQLL